MASDHSTSFREAVELARTQGDTEQLITSVPYAGQIGLKIQSIGDEWLFCLPENPDNIGNPLLPAIHGGVIGGFMELAASLHLLLTSDEFRMPLMIDFSIDYLRAGKLRDTYAECLVVRQGNRVANVEVKAWQTSRDELIATGRAHYLLRP